MILLKTLFYTSEESRFFSFSITQDGISLLASTSLIAQFPEYLIYKAIDSDPLICVQVDLRVYGLDRYGIVYGMSCVLESVPLLYLSTANTANVLIGSIDVEKAFELLKIGAEDSDSVETEVSPGPKNEGENHHSLKDATFDTSNK